MKTQINFEKSIHIAIMRFQNSHNGSLPAKIFLSMPLYFAMKNNVIVTKFDYMQKTLFGVPYAIYDTRDLKEYEFYFSEEVEKFYNFPDNAEVKIIKVNEE